ncbi:NUDIX domain-containing protein [Candidatus Roizmanbacteria bacterium]|nr:NUDIX domain-containing protein [Candidatus Roizmanbacteria bacterium]
MKQSSKITIIETIALIHITDRKLLLARSRGKKAFYMPGGKRDRDEDQHATLIREVKEELQVKLDPSTLTFYGVFEAEAYGKAEGVLVRTFCYTGKYIGRLSHGSEVEEIGFFSHKDYFGKEDTAPAVRLIFKDLKSKGLIE